MLINCVSNVLRSYTGFLIRPSVCLSAIIESLTAN